jgi:hypothetical protein
VGTEDTELTVVVVGVVVEELAAVVVEMAETV